MLHIYFYDSIQNISLEVKEYAIQIHLKYSNERQNKIDSFLSARCVLDI